jgi:hypothetical protein
MKLLGPYSRVDGLEHDDCVGGLDPGPNLLVELESLEAFQNVDLDDRHHLREAFVRRA